MQWPEDENDEAPVKVIGEGLPRSFELEPITNVSVEELSRQKIEISLGGGHDPARNPVQSLTKSQSFSVKVTLPAEMAKEQGTTLEVSVKGLNDEEDEDTITLTGTRPSGLRPVVYSHAKAVFINECDVFANAPRNPQFMSLQWIFGGEGDCLDIETENGDRV